MKRLIIGIIILLCTLPAPSIAHQFFHVRNFIFFIGSDLHWTTPTTNDDGSPLTDLAGYKVYWGAAPGNYTNSMDVGNVNTVTFVFLNAPVRGCYVVTAYNSLSTESVNSNEVCKLDPR